MSQHIWHVERAIWMRSICKTFYECEFDMFLFVRVCVHHSHPQCCVVLELRITLELRSIWRWKKQVENWASGAVALDKVFIINTSAVMYLANGLRMRWGVRFYGSQEISFDENKNIHTHTSTHVSVAHIYFPNARAIVTQRYRVLCNFL